MFSPLLLPPHRSARAERPEAGGRSGEEAPGSPRRGRLGPPPPAPLRSAPGSRAATAPQNHSAAERRRRQPISAREGRGAAPPTAGASKGRAPRREAAGRRVGHWHRWAPARALRQVWRRPSVGDLLRSPSARRPFPLSHLRVPSLGTCLRGSGPPSESRSPLSVCEIVGFFQLSPILSLLSANCCLGWENLSRCRLWWLGVQTGEPLDAPLRHM